MKRRGRRGGVEGEWRGGVNGKLQERNRRRCRVGCSIKETMMRRGRGREGVRRTGA